MGIIELESYWKSLTNTEKYQVNLVKRYCMLTCGLVLIYDPVMLICKNCLSHNAVLDTFLVFDLLIDGLCTTV